MEFILTKELGRLVKWLRILGFDTKYFREDNIGGLIVEALREKRIIVTRSKRFANVLDRQVIVIESNDIRAQLRELYTKVKFPLEKEKMFSRCVICNELLKEVDKGTVESKVPPYVYQTHETFNMCDVCKRVYWQGSHWGNVEEVVNSILRS